MLALPTAVKKIPGVYPHEAVKLYFGDDPSDEFHVRGAIAWPDPGIPGMALVGIQQIRNRKVYILQEYVFQTIEPTETRDGFYQGLRYFILEVWQKYMCRHYYIEDKTEQHRARARDIVKSDIINPNPTFIPIRFKEDETLEMLMEGYIKEKRVAFNRESELFKHVSDTNADPNQRRGKKAFRILIAGFHFHESEIVRRNPREIEYRW